MPFNPAKYERKTSGHGCSKNDSLIWNKLRAQLHGSVHPTHSVTLMGGGEQENQPVRSQSARLKKQERLKKKPWNAKPKPTGSDLQMARTPTLLTQATAGTRRSVLLPGLSRLLAHLTHHPAGQLCRGLRPADLPETQVRSARGRRITEERRDARDRLHEDHGACDVLAVLKGSVKTNLHLGKLKVLVSASL